MFARLSNVFGSSSFEPSSSQGRSPSNKSWSESANSTPIHGNNNEHYERKDNSVSVLEKMAHLYAEKLMSDIVLCVGNFELQAHRLILCASSEVFQVMLMNPEWSESREKKIYLQEAPECVEIFEKFLKYLYTGQLTLSHSSVLPVLALADKYIVKDLINICTEYMKEHIVSAARNGHLFSWLQYTITCCHCDIAEASMNHLKWNFEHVAKSEEFVCCDIDLLTTVLAQHDLVINDEMTLYNYVVHWLQRQEERLLSSCTTSFSKENLQCNDGGPFISKSSNLASKFCSPSLNQSQKKYYLRRESTCSSADPIDQMEYLTQEVMRYIRFPMMTPRQLADLLLVPLTIKYKEFFVNRMAIGMSFHSGQWDRIKEIIKDSNVANQLLFTPRLYTADQWGACLTVDNLPSLPAYHTRTLVFSTPLSASEVENNDNQLEWIVELYPKGVWFRKCLLIVYHGTNELPESILRTVRLAITAKDAEFARVRIAVLIYGIQDDIEHILNVVSTRHIFTTEDNLLNMDDILPFDSLNIKPEERKYLLEPCSSLKIHVVISPLTDSKIGSPNS